MWPVLGGTTNNPGCHGDCASDEGSASVCAWASTKVDGDGADRCNASCRSLGDLRGERRAVGAASGGGAGGSGTDAVSGRRVGRSRPRMALNSLAIKIQLTCKSLLDSIRPERLLAGAVGRGPLKNGPVLKARPTIR